MIRFFRAYLRRLLITVPLVAALVVVAVPLSGCSLRDFLKGSSQAKASVQKPHEPSGAELFAVATDELASALKEAEEAFAAGSNPTTALAQIREFSERLPELDRAVRADFAKTHKVLGKIDSPKKDEIQRRFESQYDSRVRVLKIHLAAIGSARNVRQQAAAAQEASSWLDSRSRSESWQPLGKELPHGVTDAEAGVPVLGDAIAPAYSASSIAAHPSTLPLDPTEADVAETPDAEFSPSIRSLAASLGHDPVLLYEYVRNTIHFEPYSGSRKGATDTLRQGSGNDVDAASLLIALYRASGIPSRYVFGTIDVPIDDAMNWVGVRRAEDAARLFSAGGIHSQLLLSEGQPKYLRVEHTWAEAYVAYETYRGDVEPGSLRKTWVPLDASYKRYTRVYPTNMPRPSVDVSATRSQTATDIAAAVTSSAASLAEELTDAAAVGSLASVVGSSKIVATKSGLLPIVLPHRARPSSEFTSVPDSWRETLTVALGGADGTWESLVGEAAMRRIWVEFSPAEDSDRNLLSEMGGFPSTPCYLISMRPLLVVDDQVVASGEPATPGEQVDIELALGNSSRDTITRKLLVGSRYSLTAKSGRISVDRLNSAASTLQAVRSRLSSEEVTSSEFLGSVQDAHSLQYFAQTQSFRTMGALASGIRVFEGSGLAIAGEVAKVRTVFGTPATLRCCGFNLDVVEDRLLGVSLSGSSADLVSWSLADGLLASSCEHMVFQGAYGVPAVSTARILSLAAQQEIPIRLLTTAEDLSAVDTSAWSADLLERIQSDLRAGWYVQIPETPVSLASWKGFGWVEWDPDTGAAGYMIESGLAGGSTTDAADTSSSTLMDWASKTVTFASATVTSMYKKCSFDIRGQTQTRWREVWSGKFANSADCERAQAFANVGAILVAGLAQWVEDWESGYTMQLSTAQEISRIICAFVAAYIQIQLQGLALKAISAFTKDPRHMMATSLGVSVGCSWAWASYKRQLFTLLCLEPNRPSELPMPDKSYPDYFYDFDVSPFAYC